MQVDLQGAEIHPDLEFSMPTKQERIHSIIKLWWKGEAEHWLHTKWEWERAFHELVCIVKMKGLSIGYVIGS